MVLAFDTTAMCMWILHCLLCFLFSHTSQGYQSFCFISILDQTLTYTTNYIVIYYLVCLRWTTIVALDVLKHETTSEIVLTLWSNIGTYLYYSFSIYGSIYFAKGSVKAFTPTKWIPYFSLSIVGFSNGSTGYWLWWLEVEILKNH
jgi:hypothetical protein